MWASLFPHVIIEKTLKSSKERKRDKLCVVRDGENQSNAKCKYRSDFFQCLEFFD